MPEVGDLTPSEHDRVITERSSGKRGRENRRRELRSVISEKKKTAQEVVLSRGKEPPKAGPVTGVKS